MSALSPPDRIDDLSNLREKLRAFAADRDWDQFHSPKNLAIALSVEASELLEHFQWIAMKGQSGLDINDPDQEYSLKSLPGKYSGLHLVAIMYAAFQQIDPTADIGADFKTEYQLALKMHETEP